MMIVKDCNRAKSGSRGSHLDRLSEIGILANIRVISLLISIPNFLNFAFPDNL